MTVKERQISCHPQPEDADLPQAWIRHSTVPFWLGDQMLAGVLELPLRTPAADADVRARYLTLQRAYGGRGVAMAVAGYDLRQPLQVIGMVLARLAAPTGHERDLSWLDIANGELARLSASLDHLAILSRDDDVASGGVAVGDLCLDSVLREVASTWRHHAQARGLRLVVIPTRLMVRSNARLLSVIVGILVSNAVKYTRHGGVVLGCRRRGTEVAIEVIDTGRGFSDTSDSVFSPFWREDNDDAGLGLGLSIVRRTAELLGHRVVISSRRGFGSRVGVVVDRGSSPV